MNTKTRTSLLTLGAFVATLSIGAAQAQTVKTQAAPAQKPATINTTPAAPSTATPAAAPVNAGSSAISTSEAIADASASPWSPSVALYNFKGYADEQDKRVVGNVVYLNLGYKLAPNWKITASQRFRYDLMKDSEAQAKRISDLNLRLNLSQSGIKALGADGSVLYRLTLPTTVASRVDQAMLAYVLINPSLTWKLDNSFEAGYSLAYQSTMYSAPTGAFTKASDRQVHGLGNTGTLTYNVNDSFNVYQSVGHSLAARNSGKQAVPETGLSAHGSWAELSTGLNWSPMKGLAINAYLYQTHAVSDSSNVGIIASNSDQVFGNFMLYRPEQTSVELFTSLAF